MTCKDEFLVNEILNGIKSIAEILRVLHGRNVVAHLSKGLRKSTAA